MTMNRYGQPVHRYSAYRKAGRGMNRSDFPGGMGHISDQSNPVRKSAVAWIVMTLRQVRADLEAL